MTFARALVAHLVANGVEHFVLCPGSRSGALALALAEATADEPRVGAPALELHVRIDERAAGFLALGIARATLAPVAVVTTSGTAVGNLLPAVMEASHAGVPLVLVTADRPFEVRATGANQTTRQRGIFGTFVGGERDVAPPTWGRDLLAEAGVIAAWAVSASYGNSDGGGGDAQAAGVGPVHVNIQFREPLEPDGGGWPAVTATTAPAGRLPQAAQLPAVRKGIVIAGDGAGHVAATIGQTRGWPVFAEPTSGARTGPAYISGYADLLASELGQVHSKGVEFVLVIGRPTLNRAVRALLEGAPRLWVAGFGGRWREAPVHAEQVFMVVPDSWRVGAEPADPEWMESWALKARDPVPGDWAAEAIVAATDASLHGGTLVLGSSGVIRAADRALPRDPSVGATRRLANRGLAGIDGTISTAVGVALASASPVAAVMGDLTFLHDAGGLLVGPRERTPDLRIVVVNDGGGTIFRTLEHARANGGDFERVFTTPHGADIGSLCRGFGVSHAMVATAEDLSRALQRPSNGIEVVEAVLADG